MCITALSGKVSDEDFPSGESGERSIRVPLPYLKNIENCSEPTAVVARANSSVRIVFIILTKMLGICFFY